MQTSLPLDVNAERLFLSHPHRYMQTLRHEPTAYVVSPGRSALEGSLLLRALYHLLFDKEALALAHLIHVPARHILPVGLLAKVLKLLFGRRHPVGVNVEHFIAMEDELRASSTRCALADLCVVIVKRAGSALRGQPFLRLMR